jgi:hypothetical protein
MLEAAALAMGMGLSKPASRSSLSTSMKLLAFTVVGGG